MRGGAPIKWIAPILNGGTPNGNSSNWDGDIDFVTPPDLNSLDGADVGKTARTLTAEGAASGSTVAGPGVVLSTRAPIGHIGVLDRETAFNQGCKVLTVGDREDARFIAYCLVSGRAGLQAMGQGTTFRELSAAALGDFRIPWPSPVERARIADYLDRETGEIDAMLAKLDALAEVLKERRETTVTAYVCGHGQTLHATGDPWFTELPSGWGLSQVRLVTSRVTDGSHVAPDLEDGVHDFVSTRDVNRGVVDFEGSLKTSKESYKTLVAQGCRPLPGDLLYSKDGTIGEMAVVDEDREFVVASSLIIISPDTDVLGPHFLMYALASRPAKRAALSYVRGAGLPRLSVINLARGVKVPVPPLREQGRIVSHLDEVTGRIDAMLAKVAQLKDLLIERRAALITAVVTGRKEIA